MNREQIIERLDRNEIPYAAELPEKLEIYIDLLKEWNTRMDLTAVPEDEEIIDRHFVDSLTILRSDIIVPQSALIDVGTGAGFPGMVLAMAREDLKVTLVDAQQKRLKFLAAVQEATGVRNTVLVHARAEDAAGKKEHREKYDVAAARALAPLNVLCEYLLPFIRIGGRAFCWKGPALNDELEAGRQAARILGGRLEPLMQCPVAGRNWEHRILPILKTEKTPPGYPRKAGIPKEKPLGRQ